LWEFYFDENFAIKKNEGYQTPQISALFGILDHLNDGNIPSGAMDWDKFEHIFSLVSNKPKEILDIWRPILS